MIRFSAAAVAAAVALGACASQPGPPATSVSRALPAPTPPDIAVRIGADEAGDRVTVPVGARFAVELVGVPTAGYVWTLIEAPSFIALESELSGDTAAAQSQPGYVGGQHWEVFVFTPLAPGEGELILEQRRPWESAEPASAVYRVTVVAQ
jgi:predicted secreted protein